MLLQNGEWGRACLGEERKSGLWVVRPTNAEKHGYALSVGFVYKVPKPSGPVWTEEPLCGHHNQSLWKIKTDAWGRAGASEFYDGGHTLIRTADCNIPNSIHALSSSSSSCLFTSLPLSLSLYPTLPLPNEMIQRPTSQPRQCNGESVR
jgi:hypothetical protein